MPQSLLHNKSAYVCRKKMLTFPKPKRKLLTKKQFLLESAQIHSGNCDFLIWLLEQHFRIS